MKEKILLLVSSAAVLVLLMPNTKQRILCSILFVIFMLVLGSKYTKEMRSRQYLPYIAAILLGGVFFVRWSETYQLKSFAEKLGIGSTGYILILAICSVIGAVTASYILYRFMAVAKTLIATNTYQESIVQRNGKIEIWHVFFILATSFGVVTLCSRSSFIYPFNDWTDANCFFTVGKAIANGIVPYRDIFEQKGPLLYALHALAYLISNDTFFGVYILEILLCFAFLMLTYVILCRYNHKSIFFLPVIAAIAYSSESFYMGDSAEEFCLPLLAHSLYVSVKALKNEKMPSLSEYFVIGITSGCVLWIKYTMLGFYIGLVVVPFYLLIKNHDWKKIVSMLLTIFAGVAAASAPILLYFAYNGAIYDLFEVYFYDNMFLYSGSGSSIPVLGIIGNILNGLGHLLRDNMLTAVMILVGYFGCFHSEKRYVFMHYMCLLVGTFTFVYVGGRSYPYYAFIFSLFVVFGIIYGDGILKLPKSDKVRVVGSVLVSLVLILVLGMNTYFIGTEKEELPQYQVKKIIDESGIENPTLLNYKFLDGGFYTVCDIVPNCKYFSKLNLEYDEMNKMQDYYVDNAMIDFIISLDKIDSESYKLISEIDFFDAARSWDGERNKIYYLYQKNI